MRHFLRLCSGLIALVVIAGCASLLRPSDTPLHQSEQYYNYLAPSFSDYVSDSEKWLSANRRFISTDHTKELAMNLPFEVDPAQPTDKAVLLVHGLGDSPFSFSDLAITLKQQGFHVEALLLPGHGSKPEDLMLPRYEEWQEMVDHYANLLKQEYDQVWLGGFSTGGNLVTIHALTQGGIDGLLLFSPGFQSRTPFLERFAPLASLFFDGYKARETNLARYTSAPLNGAIAYSDSARELRALLKEQTVTIPTLIAVSEADSIIDPQAVKSLYLTRFTHPNNRLIWYGESTSMARGIRVKTMKLDTHKISTGSHMSPVFSPANGYYGVKGEKRMCMNSFDDAAVQRCREGAEVWFSAWGYQESDKIHARLTWNPYYSELERSLADITQQVHAGNNNESDTDRFNRNAGTGSAKRVSGQP